MKRACLICLLMLGLFWLPCPAMAADTSTPSGSSALLDDSMNSLDFSALENYKTNIDDEITSYTSHKSAKEWLLDYIHGNWDFNPRDILSGIIKYICDKMLANSALLAKLIILSVLAALLLNLQQFFFRCWQSGLYGLLPGHVRNCYRHFQTGIGNWTEYH